MSIRKLFPSNEPFTDLPEIHRSTYRSLRKVMLYFAIVAPVFFFAASMLSSKTDFQDSISAFYHTDLGLYFVAINCVMAISLMVYRGYNKLEDRYLTAAGVFLLGVAFLPTTKTGAPHDWKSIMHAVCAVAFFAYIALTCKYGRPNRRPEQATEPEYDLAFKREYEFAWRIMLTVLLLAGALVVADGFDLMRWPQKTFWIETAAIWAFAYYWSIKSREMMRSKELGRPEGSY